MTNKKLFAFYLGGKAKKARLEVHDVAFGVGEDVEDCFEAIKAKWFGIAEKLHIDAYMVVDCADGYSVELVNKDFVDDLPKNLYLVNLGVKRTGQFVEFHKCGLVVAGSQMGAMNRAKAKFQVDFEDKHVDNIMDVDDCININSLLDGYKLKLTPLILAERNEPLVVNCYKLVK